jgi:hypothetical protein
LGANFSRQLGYNATGRCIFRLNNHYYFRDQATGFGAYIRDQKLTQFDEKNTLIPGFHIEGFSYQNYRLKEYFISLKWRKNTLR